jgi:hypothetical protein
VEVQSEFDNDYRHIVGIWVWREPLKRPYHNSQGAIKGEFSAYIDFLFDFGLLLILKECGFVNLSKVSTSMAP